VVPAADPLDQVAEVATQLLEPRPTDAERYDFESASISAIEDRVTG
jgi:hypothetical protein